MSVKDLLAAIERTIPAEIIDGQNVKDAAEMVMLDIAFSPVVERPAGDEVSLCLNPPRTSQVEQRGDRYLIVRPEQRDFEWVDEVSLKIMRARYLLLRGYYYKQLRRLSHPVRQQVLGLYFDGGVYVPPEGSELAKLLGVS